MLDVEALAGVVAGIVADEVARATGPLIARLEAVEARSADLLDEEAVRTLVIDAHPDPAEIKAAVDGAVAEAVAEIEIPAPRDGADADPVVIRAMVDEAVSALPAPRDGESVTLDDVEPMIRSAVADAVAALPEPEPGRSVTVADVEPVIATQVARAVAELPAPKDGKSVTLADVEPFIASAVERAVAAVPAPKDGVGLAGALIDRTGSLVVTMTDGRTCNLGRVEAEPAKPGLDGFGFDDLSFEYDGERGFILRFTKGERVKKFPFTVPVVLDRGVYREGVEYERGDAVSWTGSVWIAQQPTKAKPDGPDSGWRLAVKRGRDGRDLTK